MSWALPSVESPVGEERCVEWKEEGGGEAGAAVGAAAGATIDAVEVPARARSRLGFQAQGSFS